MLNAVFILIMIVALSSGTTMISDLAPIGYTLDNGYLYTCSGEIHFGVNHSSVRINSEIIEICVCNGASCSLKLVMRFLEC